MVIFCGSVMGSFVVVVLFSSGNDMYEGSVVLCSGVMKSRVSGSSG